MFDRQDIMERLRETAVYRWFYRLGWVCPTIEDIVNVEISVVSTSVARNGFGTPLDILPDIEIRTQAKMLDLLTNGEKIPYTDLGAELLKNEVLEAAKRDSGPTITDTSEAES